MTCLLKRVCEGDGDGPCNPWPLQGYLNDGMQHKILLLVALIRFSVFWYVLRFFNKTVISSSRSDER